MIIIVMTIVIIIDIGMESSGKGTITRIDVWILDLIGGLKGLNHILHDARWDATDASSVGVSSFAFGWWAFDVYYGESDCHGHGWVWT